MDGGLIICDAGNKRLQELFLDGRPARILATFKDGTIPSGIARATGSDFVMTSRKKTWVVRADASGAPRWTVKAEDAERTGPWDAVVLLDGRVVVADHSNHQLLILDPSSGAAIGTLQPTAPTALAYPACLAVDRAGLIYVSDSINHRILVLQPDGTVARTLGSKGSGPGQLNGPWGVAVDSRGSVYVADWRNNRIVVYAPDGTAAHFATPAPPTRVMVDSRGTIFVTGEGGSLGSYVALF